MYYVGDVKTFPKFLVVNIHKNGKKHTIYRKKQTRVRENARKCAVKYSFTDVKNLL